MTDSAHPDVVPFAQGDPISPEQRAEITTHLRECGECRDLVLFIRKTNATLRYEGRVSRVAWAMRMSQDALEREIERVPAWLTCSSGRLNLRSVHIQRRPTH